MPAGSTRSKWSSETGPETLFGGKDASLFGRRQRRARGARLPVVAVTGFLGSGKTTLIRALLDTPEGAGTAVVVNEYGGDRHRSRAVAVEQRCDRITGNAALPQLRSDLQETRTLPADRARGAVPSFVRVIIETSGLLTSARSADLATDRRPAANSICKFICVVDGSPRDQLRAYARGEKQVALADRIIRLRAISLMTARAIGWSRRSPRQPCPCRYRPQWRDRPVLLLTSRPRYGAISTSPRPPTPMGSKASR
jgi:hypothetical protein